MLNADTGAQILSENLPLEGLTYENKNDPPQIEIQVGKSTEHHQTHNIIAPTKVYFRRTDESSGGTIEIEEANGTKTLISLTAPTNASVKDEVTKTAKATVG